MQPNIKRLNYHKIAKLAKSRDLRPLNLRADQLAAMKNKRGDSGLHAAARHGCLNQINGGVNEKQLRGTVNTQGLSALDETVLNGHLRQIKGSIHLSADQLAKVVGEKGFTGLHAAAFYGQLDLLAGGATAEQLNAVLSDHRVSALYSAIQGGNIRQIKGGVTAEQLAATKQIADFGLALVTILNQNFHELLEAGVPIQDLTSIKTDTRNIPQTTALHLVAYNGQLDQVKGGVTVEQLLESKDQDGNTPLHLAALQGHLHQIKGGVTAQQLLSPRNNKGDTGLHLAVAGGCVDQISGGVTATQMTGEKGQQGLTPLHLASLYNCLDQIRGGVTAEQLAAVCNDEGNTALHLATDYHWIKGGVPIELLLSTKDRLDRPALLGAASHDGLHQIHGGATAEQLLQARDESGMSGLHAAAANGFLDHVRGGVTVKQLLGAKDANGQTPLDYAAQCGRLSGIFNGDFASVWSSLDSEAQARLRQAMEGNGLTPEMARVTGLESPCMFHLGSDPNDSRCIITCDGKSEGRFITTRKIEQFELSFPMSKKLACVQCGRHSRRLVVDRDFTRHYCPGCGAVYQFDVEAYEKRALQIIKGLRWSFPLSMPVTCRCRAVYVASFPNAQSNLCKCPGCGTTGRYFFVEAEKDFIEMVKMNFADGTDEHGWTLVKSGPEMEHTISTGQPTISKQLTTEWHPSGIERLSNESEPDSSIIRP